MDSLALRSFPVDFAYIRRFLLGDTVTMELGWRAFVMVERLVRFGHVRFCLHSIYVNVVACATAVYLGVDPP
jgi:hypothetical protein